MDTKLIGVMSLGVLLSGCVVTTTAQLVEKERVDQSLSGNQGYLAGKPPEPQKVHREETRQIIQVDVEMPTLAELQQKSLIPDNVMKGNRGYLTGGGMIFKEGGISEFSSDTTPASVVSRAEDEMEIPSANIEERSKRAVMEYAEYRVRKGDTLQSIAANPKIYGDSSRWVQIYEANRGQLKNPDKIYPGQKLRIPRR